MSWPWGVTTQSGNTFDGVTVTAEEIMVPCCLPQVDKPISKDSRNQHVKGKVKSQSLTCKDISLLPRTLLVVTGYLCWWLQVMLNRAIYWPVLHEITTFGKALTHPMPFYHLTLLMKKLIVKIHIPWLCDFRKELLWNIWVALNI